MAIGSANAAASASVDAPGPTDRQVGRRECRGHLLVQERARLISVPDRLGERSRASTAVA